MSVILTCTRSQANHLPIHVMDPGAYQGRTQGGGGDGGYSPLLVDFFIFFLFNLCEKVKRGLLKIKWTKSEEFLYFWGRLVFTLTFESPHIPISGFGGLDSNKSFGGPENYEL